ncbi:MAG TPA: hypothetical protein VIO32_06085, partial [Candidatus Baltobacteraceae bacterium]
MNRRVFAFVLVAALAACGGGSTPPGGGNPAPTPAPTATPTAPPTQTESSSLNGTTNTVTFPAISSGVSGTVTLPAVTSGSATVTLVLSSTLPGGVPVPQARRIHHVTSPQILGAPVTPLAYVSVTPSATVTISTTPAFTFNFPAGVLSGFAYAAVYDEANSAAGWNEVLGPLSAGGTSLSFPAVAFAPPFTLAGNDTYIFALVETGTPLPTPTPVPTATPTPVATATPTPVATATPVPGSTPPPVTGNAVPLPDVTANPGYGWAPYQVASELQFPVQSGWDGTGETIAIVMDANYNAAGLNTYLTRFHIPSTTRTISATPGPDGAATSASDLDESQLDVETVAGLAPGANVVEYTMPSLSNKAFIDTINQIASTNAAQVISYSAGGCEFNGEQNAGVATVFAAAAASGIAIAASSGDQGNQCYNGPNTYVNGVNWPASDQNIFSVGGTNTASGTITYTDPTVLLSNAVWNDAAFCNQQCAGGGGVSQYIPIPSYQQGVVGAQSSTMRNVPDISMPAEGMAMFDGTSWFQMYGTSWSAPEYAALMAEIYEYCKSTIANPVSIPYYVAAHYPQAFIDVVSGNDQFNGSTSFYTAGAGYDNASGFGVPYGMAYANTLCPNRTPQVRRVAALPMQPHAAAEDRVVDVSPRISGIADAGPRRAAQTTQVQIV